MGKLWFQFGSHPKINDGILNRIRDCPKISIRDRRFDLTRRGSFLVIFNASMMWAEEGNSTILHGPPC